MKLKAFTLTEVLVALLIIALLAGAVYRFMAGIAEDRARIETVANRNIGATRLFSMLESDLLTCVAVADDGGPGVKGDASSLRIKRRAVRLSTQNVPDFTDATSTEYRFNKSSKVLFAARDGGASEVLADNIALVRFRYLSDGEWKTEFDSASLGSVPAAVEVAVWFNAGWEEQSVEQDVPEEDALEDVRLPPPDRLLVVAVHDATSSGVVSP